jgi:hypothetical protein
MLSMKNIDMSQQIRLQCVERLMITGEMCCECGKCTVSVVRLALQKRVLSVKDKYRGQ